MARRAFFSCLSFAALFALPLFLLLPGSARTATDPWTASQTIQAEDLAKELAKSPSSLTIVCTGFRRLFNSGHITGAQFHGPAGTDEGLKDLTAWAYSLPRSTKIVIYCGCCPMERCPNIRPAFSALRNLGFKDVRVLILPYDFAVDWAARGFLYEH